MKKSYYLPFLLCIFFTQNMLAQFFYENFPDGLPSDWESKMVVGNGNATSKWNHTSTGPGGGFAVDPLNSTTAFNGWMLFDSDANCSGAQDVWLISPAIDCSQKDTVFLGFETYYVRYNDITNILVSVDNQQSWDTFPIFENLINNEFAGGATSVNPFFATLDISSVAAYEDVVHFAFQFKADDTTIIDDPTTVGCAYSWQIDDVGLFDTNPLPAYDVQVSNFFFAVPPATQMPASQLMPIHFLADVKNSGANTATDVQLQVDMEDTNSGLVVFKDTLEFGSIASGDVVENFIFNKSWLPDSTAASYFGKYKVTVAENDIVPSNNFTFFEFAVTDSVFAKDSENSPISFAPNDSMDWSFAAHYFVTNGSGNKLSSIQFGIGNPQEVVGGIIDLQLYEWEDENNDGIVQASERGLSAGAGALVAEASHEITSNSEEVVLVMTNTLDGSSVVPLNDSTHYILAAQLHPTPDNPTPIRMRASTSPDYLAMTFLTDSLGMPLYNAFINENNGNLNAELFPFIHFTPMLRMHINPIQTSTRPAILPSHFVKINPNPTQDFVELNFLEGKNFSEVALQVFGTNGDFILEKKISHFQNEKVLLDFSKINSGIYFLKIILEEGVLTKKIMVTH